MKNQNIIDKKIDSVNQKMNIGMQNLLEYLLPLARYTNQIWLFSMYISKLLKHC